MLGISMPDLLVLALAALFILGPERLPAATRWLGRGLRQARDYVGNAQEQLRSELGPEFDDIRKPIEDLTRLRDFNPRQALTRHLLDAADGHDPRQDVAGYPAVPEQFRDHDDQAPHIDHDAT